MATTTRRAMASAIVLGLAVLPWLPAQGATPKTKRVSVRSNGAQAEGNHSQAPAISASGRFVAFQSAADNLAPGDDSDSDIFVHNRKTKKTKIVSVRSNGDHGVGQSYDPAISANGRFIVFESTADNLVPNDNGHLDVFVHDRKTKKTRRVSVRSNGDEGSSDSYDASVSADGRFIAFLSDASDLIANDENGYYDVFVHDRETKKTKRVSVRSNGDESDSYNYAPAISGNGVFVSFHSEATNLVPNDENNTEDVFVHNRKTGKTKRVSVRSNGDEGDGAADYPSISASGRFVAFSSVAPNLVPNDENETSDIFVHNRKTGKTKRASVRSNGDEAELGWSSFGVSISPDGRFVAFQSGASNLVNGDENSWDDIFVHDRKTGRTRRATIRANGDGSQDGDGEEASISGGGRFVAFRYEADDLVPGDDNTYYDVFVRGPLR